MEQFIGTEREAAKETPQGVGLGALPSGGKRAAGRRGVRFSVLLLLILALAGVCLSAYLGAELARVRNELLLLRQSEPAEPPNEPLPPAGGEEPPAGGPAAGDPSSGEVLPELERPAYQDLYPELYAQPHEWNSVSEGKTAYLTFDDGPSARTPEVLEILERYGVKGTFFVVNQGTEQSKQWMRDIVAAGHTIGVHSYTHDYETIYSSVEAYLDDFAQMYDVILEATGVAPQIFRFPGGSINAYNGQIYQEIVSEMTRRGFVYYDWNRMTGDAVRRTPAAAVLAKNALSDIGATDRIILLAHDSKRYTNMVAALPDIIEGYQAAGFTLEALTPEVKPIVYAYPNPK